MQAKTVVFLLVFLVVIGILFFVMPLLGQGKDVEIRDDVPWFFPAVLEIEPGTTVTWHLKSPAVHPVMQVEGPVEFHSGHFTDSWSYKFDKPGLYVYICPIHPYMKGVIGVGQAVPKEKIPAWVNWPLDARRAFAGLPEEKGIGKVWVDAQFHKVEGKEKPGSIIIINAETWVVEKVISDPRINNPHNLTEWNGKILQTNWFDKFLSIIDKETGELEQHILVGESPAHVMPVPGQDKAYVTLQGDDALAVLNKDLEITEKIRTPKGPHGHWVSEDGKVMAVASTEKGAISVWDTERNEILFEAPLGEEKEKSHDEKEEAHLHSLPLMAGVTLDGKFAFAATNLTGKFFVFDIGQKREIKSFDVGAGPVQAVPSPDGKYVVVPLSGSGETAIISTEGWEIVKKIKNVGRGAHGVAFGEKEQGGWFAFVSNKFDLWLTVIDMGSLEIAGYVPLPSGAWGGQGVIITN